MTTKEIKKSAKAINEFTKEISSSKKKSREFLQKAGIHTLKGNLKKKYK